jgi:hypothetical protein
MRACAAVYRAAVAGRTRSLWDLDQHAAVETGHTISVVECSWILDLGRRRMGYCYGIDNCSGLPQSDSFWGTEPRGTRHQHADSGLRTVSLSCQWNPEPSEGQVWPISFHCVQRKSNVEMGNCCSSAFAKPKELTILVIGLDNSGKTTLCGSIKGGACYTRV